MTYGCVVVRPDGERARARFDGDGGSQQKFDKDMQALAAKIPALELARAKPLPKLVKLIRS